MARKCKTPAKVIALIDKHNNQMAWITECLRVKKTVPVENQANHIKERSEDYWIGLAHGHSNMLENILHEHNCYAGFAHVGPVATVLSDGSTFMPFVRADSPDFANWRVQYMLRG